MALYKELLTWGVRPVFGGDGQESMHNGTITSQVIQSYINKLRMSFINRGFSV